MIKTRFAAPFSLLILAIAVGALSLFSPSSASASPTVTTDKEDYDPSDTVVVSGSGFGPGDLLDIVITRPDSTIITGDGTGTEGWDTLMTTGNGSFDYNYILNGILGSYTVDVYASPWNGLETFDVPIATTTFTDFTSAGLSINSAAYSTNALAVTLTASWSDGGTGGDPTQARFFNDTTPETSCPSASGTWQTLTEIGTSNTATFSWTVASQTETGLRKVCGQLAQGSLNSPTKHSLRQRHDLLSRK